MTNTHRRTRATVAIGLSLALACGHGYAQEFRSQFERIHQFEQQGLLTNALNLCSDLLQQHTDSKTRGTLLLERGNLRLKLKLFGDAEPDVEEAIRLLPPNPVYHQIQGNILAGLGRYKEAIASFTKALQLKPNDDVLLANRAHVHLQFGFAMPAISDCSMAIDLNPNRVSAHSVRAEAYMQQTDYAAAARDLRRVIEMAEPDANSCADYAKCLYLLGKTNESLSFLSKAAELTVADPGLQKCLMAGVLTEIGDVKRALMLLDLAVSLDPTNGVCLESHGSLRMLTNDLDAAAAEIEQGIKSWPHGPAPGSAVMNEDSAYRSQGWLHLLQGNYGLAKVDFEAAIATDPTVASCYGGAVVVALLKGDRVSALQTAKRGMARCSSKAELACLCILCGDSLSKDTSEDLLQYSPELWPYPLVQYSLGHISAEHVITYARRPTFD
jgi:tetratricopeptide (TPR) repeat protein